jgi:hypothetical protein
MFTDVSEVLASIIRATVEAASTFKKCDDE